MNALISVIVPIYNVEPYLHQCIDSILAQTYKDLEVILVDDGSRDGCGVICDEYAKKDQRVRVIHKTNGGLSDARNVGLSVMSGEYLVFVDSDDWLPEGGISCLYEIAKLYGTQLVIGNSDRRNENGRLIQADAWKYEGTAVLSKTEAMLDMLTHGCAAWAKLYHRSIHEGICFPKGDINEDEAIVLQILDRCDKVAVTERIVYHYRHRQDSITTNSFSVAKLAWQRHCRENLHFIQQNYPQLEHAAAMRYRSSLLWTMTEIAMLPSCADYKKDIDEMMLALHQNMRQFRRIPFEWKRDRLRFTILKCLGFWNYRRILRVWRGAQNAAI